MIKKIASLLVLCISTAQATVLLMTHSHNRPDFIEIQYHTFKKFLKDDYEFIVFNDAPSEDMRNQIEIMCKKYGLRCIRIPQTIHTYAYLYRLPRESFNNPCVRCANVVQYSLNEVGLKHDDIVAIIDSDMFLVKEFSIREYMRNTDLAGVHQARDNGVEYIWNGLVFFDMRTQPNKERINFNCGEVNRTPVDVGGQMHHYLKQTPQARVTFIQQDYVANHASKSNVELASLGFSAPMTRFIQANPPVVELYANGAFIHYRSGTNWDRQSTRYHMSKTQILNQLIEELVAH